MGFLFTAYAFIAAIRSLLEGMHADRFGRKSFLFLLNGIIAISGVIYASTRNLPIHLITSALGGLGSVYLSSPSEQAMLSEKTTVFTSIISSYQPVFIISLIGFACVYLTISLREERWRELSKSDEGIVTVEEAEYEYIGKNLSRFVIVAAFDALDDPFIGRFLSYWFYIKFCVGPRKIDTLLHPRLKNG